MANYRTTEWLRIATAGIVSPKEQAAAKQELLDHIEDHMEALLAAGFSAEDAEKHAVFAMGDPETTAKLLRKVHQPVLTKFVQLCKWTAVVLAAALVLQVGISLFFIENNILQRLWCEDPMGLYGYNSFETQQLPENVLARRVTNPQYRTDLGDYVLTVQKAALDKQTDGTRIVLLVEMKADHLWDAPSRFAGTVRVTCENETYTTLMSRPSHFRRLRRHYHYFFLTFQGDLIDADALTLDFTNGERSFSLPIKLEGGVVYEK